MEDRNSTSLLQHTSFTAYLTGQKHLEERMFRKSMNERSLIFYLTLQVIQSEYSFSFVEQFPVQCSTLSQVLFMLHVASIF